MKIDLDHIAKLAKLKIRDEEREKFTNQMQGIIEMVENLPDVKKESLLDRDNVMELRKDEVRPSYKREDMLKNTPDVAAGCVAVPATQEE